MRYKIAVIYNEPKHSLAEDHWLARSSGKQVAHAAHPVLQHDFRDASEFGVLEQMEAIASVLREAGRDVLVFSVDDDVSRLATFLHEEDPDFIFNCCESVLGHASLEMNIAAVYELYGIAYTGSSPLTLGLALNKGLAKNIFTARRVPTPLYQIFEPGESATMNPGLRFPFIVKPVREDASIGIDQHAIVTNEKQLRQRAAFVWEEFGQAALVEEFIEGRELNVALLGSPEGGLNTLPISEIEFGAVPSGMPHIVSYEAKWVEDSPMYRTTLPYCPAELDIPIEREARELALRAANAIGLRDYGRVDLRLDSNNKLFVLEANPNPDISIDAGFMRAAKASGRSFAGTINEIMDLAIERSKNDAR